MRNGDSVRESDRDRTWNELDGSPQASDCHANQKQPAMSVTMTNPETPNLRDDPRDNPRTRPWTPICNARTTQRRN